MNHKSIVVKNPSPTDKNGEYIRFEQAKGDRNTVRLSGWNNVVLTFSAN